eukprot:1059380-Amphidinium_carterae.1
MAICSPGLQPLHHCSRKFWQQACLHLRLPQCASWQAAGQRSLHLSTLDKSAKTKLSPLRLESGSKTYCFTARS